MKDLIKSILECSADPEKWDTVLDTFNSELKIASCALFSVHEFAEMRTNFHFSALSRKKNTPEILETMRTAGDVDDLKGYRFMFENEPLRLYDEMTLFGVNRFEDLPPSAIRNLLGTWGLKVRSTAMLNQRGPWMDGLFCQHRTLRECHEFVADKRADLILLKKNQAQSPVG